MNVNQTIAILRDAADRLKAGKPVDGDHFEEAIRNAIRLLRSM